MKIGRMKFGVNRAVMVAMLGLCASGGLGAEAQVPVSTTMTTLSSSLSGVAGNIAVNKFGDVFEASTYGTGVYEFPANGGAPILLFTLGSSSNYSGKGLGGLAVDANQNLYVTTIYVGGQTSTDSAIYELPYVNNAYPATFTLNAPVAACGAAPTAVCSWGNFLQATGYYYQGWDFAIDGKGTGYMVTLFDNTGKNNIYACNASCESKATNGTILVGGLPNPVLSLTADAAGDVFYADGSSSVYEVVAGTSTATVVGTGFSTTIGVALDQAGNLFVTDANAIYEIPVRSGLYSQVGQVEVVPTPGGSARGYNGGGVAVDVHGNVYAASGFSNLYKFNRNNGIFAAAATASGSSTLTFNVVLNAATTSVAATVVGGQAAEFVLSANTCAAGGAKAFACTVTGTFSPAGVGRRKAVAVLKDNLGNTVNVSLFGVGQGSAFTVDPGTLTQPGSGFKSAAGVAIDSAGNTFVADTSANAVYEYPAGGGARVAVGTALNAPTGVAVDGAGNLYIADTGAVGTAKGRVVEIPVVSGALSSVAQTTIATGLGTPQGMTLDGSGTLYVADSTNKDVYVLSAALFGQGGGTTFGTGLVAPSDAVVDALGNLYIADPGANQVVAISQEGIQATVGSGFKAPTGVTADASGSLIVADQGNKRIVRIPNEKGVLTPTDLTSVSTKITSPYAVRIDGSGNLVVSDNVANVLDALNRVNGTATFTGVNVGTSSAPLQVIVASEGTAGLVLGTPVYTLAAGDFALVQGTPACAAGSTIAAAFTCDLSATFSPTSKAVQNVHVSFSTNAQNAASTSLTLSGTGLQLATPGVSFVQTAPAGSPNYGATVTFTATVTGSAAASNAVPTGSVALVVDGSLQPAVTLNAAGTAQLSVSGLNGGSHTLSVEYSGDNNYAAANTPNTVITVVPAGSATTLAITTTAINPVSTTAGSAVVFSSTLTPSIAGAFTGTVSFMSGTTVLATAPVLGGAGGTYTASANVTTVPVGSYSVVAVYSGNADYSGSTSSPAIPLVVVSGPTGGATFTVTPSPSTITSSINSFGSTTLTVTSLAGFQGAVDFSCAGLPAHATCIFNPAILTLLANNTGSPVSVGVLTNVLTIAIDQGPVVTPTAIFWWSGVLMFGLLGFRRKNRSWAKLCQGLAASCLLLGMATGLAGCGSSTNITPGGTSTVTVTAVATPSVPTAAPTSSAGTVTVSFPITLTVK